MKPLLTDDIHRRLKEAADRIRQARDESSASEALDALERQVLELLDSARLATVTKLGGRLAHKINSPLGAISGSAQLLIRRLRTDRLEPESLSKCLKYAEDILMQTERCAAITRELAAAEGSEAIASLLLTLGIEDTYFGSCLIGFSETNTEPGSRAYSGQAGSDDGNNRASAVCPGTVLGEPGTGAR